MVVRSTAITPAPARTAEPKQRKSGQDDGRVSARDGNEQPQRGTRSPARRPIDAADIARAAERLQELARESNRELDFRVDDISGRTVITVRNESTGEIIRQIPAEEVLNLARSLGSFGTIVDSTV